MKPFYTFIFFLCSASCLYAQCSGGLMITQSTQAGVCGSVLTVTGTIAPGAFIEWSTGVRGTLADGADVTPIGNGSVSTSYSVSIMSPGCVPATASGFFSADSPNVTATSTDLSACGAMDGTITLMPSSGADIITWSDPSLSGSTTPSGLVAGVYGVTVEYTGTGCIVPLVIRLREPGNNLVLDIDVNNECPTNTVDDGGIIATVTGGVGPYDFDWDVNPLDITNDPDGIVSYSGLPQGMYNVTVTDAMGCSIIGNANIAAATLIPQITGFSGNTTICNGNTTDITVEGTDIDGPNTMVVWTLPDGTMVSGTVADGTLTLTNASQIGTYTVTITRTNDCETSATVDITNTLLTIDPGATFAASCDGSPTAVQSVTVTGGTGPYVFDWDLDGTGDFDDGDTSPLFDPIATGDITVTARDMDGCEVSRTFPRENFIAPDISIMQEFSCVTGEVTLTIVDNDPVSYTNMDMITWSTGTSGTGSALNSITVSSSGMYDVTINRTNGCTGIATIDVTVPDPIIIDIAEPFNPSCDGSATAVQSVSVSGGVGPYLYDWDLDGLGDLDDTPTSPMFAPTGDVVLVVQDANGCMASRTWGKDVFNAPNISVNETGVNCAANTVQLTLFDNDMPSFSNVDMIDWSEGTSGTLLTGADVIEVASTGTYTVTVTKSNGCSSTASVDVTSVPDLSVEVTATIASCQGADNGAIDVTVTGGSPPYDFDWNNDGVGDFNDPEDLTNLAPNTYSLTVRDNDGCTVTVMATVVDEMATIDITDMLYGGCGDDGTLSVYVSVEYTNPPATGDIEVEFQGQTQSVAIGGNNPFYLVFNVTPDGSTGNVATAYFTDANCSDTYTYNSFLDCSNVGPACMGDDVGGTIYMDYNNNGIQDPGENGEANLQIFIFDTDYTAICDLNTDDFGNFTCSGVAPGQEVIIFLPGAAGYVVSIAGVDNDLNFFSTIAGDCDISIGLILDPADVLPPDLDFNYEIGNKVWEDLNNNSIQNAGEPPIAGVNVELYDDMGNLIAQTMTDANGMYYFNDSNVPGGIIENTDYIIVFGTMGQFDPSTGFLTVGGNSYTLVPQNLSANQSGSDPSIAMGTGFSFDGLPYITMNSGMENMHNQDAGFLTDCPALVNIDVQNFPCGTFISLIAESNLPDSSYVQWSNGQAGYVVSTTDGIYVNGNGIYSVTVTSPNGCEQVYMQDINTMNGFGMEVAVSPSCSGNDGMIQIIASGNNPIDYDWEIDAFDGMDTATGLAPGVYSVTVSTMDGGFCGNAMDITVPDMSTVTDIVLAPLGCGDQIQVVTNGPFPDGTYFEWSNGQADYWPFGDDIYVNQSGLYTVTVTYPNGCTETFSKDMTVNPDGPDVNVVVTPTCIGMNTGVIDISASFGGGTIEYDWADDTYDGMSTVTGLAPGEYEVRINFSQGGSICARNNMTIRVEEAPAFTIMETIVGSTGCTVGIGSSIDIEIPDGLSPFTYDWDNDGTGDFDDTQDLMNIPPGTYTVVVRDAAGCEQTAMYDVPFSGTEHSIEILSVTNATCGTANGAIDIMIAGGSGNYDYDWDTDGAGDFDDPQDLSGISAGNYTVVVRDRITGCTVETMISVSEDGSDITLDIVATVACDADNLGSIDMTINTGIIGTSFTIDWDNDGTGDTDDPEDLANLPAGTYSVTVTQIPTGCMAVGSVEVMGNDLSVSRMNTADCDSTGDAAIDLTITGGVMPYMIDWNTDGTGDFDDPEDLVGLDPATATENYQAIIIDGAGCRDTVSINPFNLRGLELTTEQFVDCENLQTTLIVNGQFGTIATIDWSTGESGTRADGLDTIMVSAPSTYMVTVSKNNGCVSTAAFDVLPVTDIVLDFTHIDICPGNVSGSIDMTITGGLAPYIIDWDNDGIGDNDDMEDLINLPAGDYNVTVTDANNCTGTGTVTIANGPVIEDFSTSVDECGNTLLMPKFTNVEDGAYFEWSIGTSGFYPDNSYTPDPYYIASQFINTSGEYSVTITNPDGCSAVFTGNVTVTEPDFAFDVDVIPACGGANGSITINPSGGTMPYNITWSDGTLTGFTQNNLAAGDYFVIVSDMDACSSAATIRVPEGTPFDLLAFSTDECVGINPFGGSIDLTITGGIGPFTIDWDNDGTGDNDDMEDISGLSAATYSVTVTSAEGCINTTSVDIGTQMPLPLIIGSSSICPGTTQDIYLMDADPTYDIEWSTGVMGTVADQADTIQIMQPGIYGVTITNEDGCSNSSSIIVSSLYEIFIDAIDQGCNDELGRIDLEISGDTGPYTIDWDNDGVGDNDDPEDLFNLAPGTYTVTVTDAMGCQQTQSVVIEPFDAIIIGTLGIDPLCNGVPGSASVFVGGDGRSPFTFIWSSNAGVPIGTNTSVATGLDAGVYSVTVIDAVGCREEATFVLDPPIINLDVTADITNANCALNLNDGEIDITVMNGVEPYMFNWSNGATTEDLIGVGVGNYDLTVTDANGCFIETTFDITGFLDVSITSVQNVCDENDLSGGIDVSVTGGSGSFTYDWDNDGVGENDDTEDLTGVGPGLYTLIIQDQTLFCTGTLNAEVLNVKPNVGIIGDTTICQGQETTLQAIGDIYDGEIITWSTGQSGTTAMDADTINVSTVGIYTVITTSPDAAACMDTAQVRVVPALEVFANASNLGCNGELGEIDLQITGDSGPYQVDWDTDGTGDFDDPEDLTNLVAGTYNVAVANVDGCVVTSSVQIEPFDLIANGIITQDPACEGVGGVIAVFPGGDGRPPFTFEWSSNVVLGPGDNPQVLMDLEPGDYTVTVTDDNGCQQVEMITLNPPLIFIDVPGIVTPSSCSTGDNNGVIDITPNGGTMPYTFNWTTGDSSEDLSGIGSGEYIVTVTDFDGCMSIDTFNVAGTLSIDIVGQTVACSNDGTIDVDIVGSTGPYTFDWSNDGTGDFDDPEDLSGLAPGMYTLVVRDAMMCEGTRTIEIIEGHIEVDIIGPDMVCTGMLVDLEVFDVNDPPLDPDTQIEWSTGDTGLMMDGFNIIQVDVPGLYSVTVTTATGCSDVANFALIAPYEVFITPRSLGCNGELGNIELEITGDTGPYTIDWSNDGVGDNDDPPNITNLAAGTYSVTITDINGCMYEESVEILPFDEIIIGTVEIDPLCNGVDGTVGVFVGGDGRSPFTYIWSSNAGVAFGDNVAFISGLSAGTYTVTVIDNNGCREEKEFILEGPFITIDLDANIIGSTCTGGGNNDGSIDLTVNGGAGPYMYEWSNGANTEDLSSLPLGSYDVTVTDQNGCFVIEQFIVPGLLDLDIVSTDDVCYDDDTSGAIDISVIGGSGVFEYDWDNDGMGDFDDPEDLTGIGPGNYRVVVRDVNTQCEGTIDTTIFNLNPDINIVGDTTICADQVTTLQVIGNIINGEILEWSTGQVGTLATDGDTINVGDIGIYSVIATTVGSTVCRDTATVRVVPALEIFLNAVNLGCNDELGGVDLDIFGDSGPHLVDWDIDGTGDFDDDEDLTGLAIGTYNVTVVNADGCPATASAEVGEFDLFVNGIVKQDPVCDGLFGVIGVFPGGDGRPPFTLEWSANVDPPPPPPGQIVMGLEPGTYMVTVTDGNGCMQSDTIVMEPYTRVITTLGDIEEVTCTGGEMNGAIDLSVMDGGGTYTYNWSNGLMTEDIDMLSPGTYTVLVNDQDGCVARDTFELLAPDQIENLEIQGDTFICNDGIAKLLTVTGDFTATDTIRWSTGVMGMLSDGADQISITSSGSYSVTVTNPLGCATSTSIEVHDESIDDLTILGELVICEDEARLLYVVGDFDEDDLIHWGVGVLGNSATGADSIMVNSPGVYDVTVTNTFDCVASTSAEIVDVGIMGITINGDNFLCENEDKNLIVTGDIASDATIEWNTGVMGMLSDGADQITINTPDTYIVTVMNSFGCIAIDSIIVTDEGIDDIDIDGNPLICTGGLSQDLTVIGDFDGSAMVEWSTGEMGLISDGFDQITISTSGIYGVTVTNSFDCMASTSIEVQEAIIDVELETDKMEICAGELATLTAQGNFDSMDLIEWSTGGFGTAAMGFDQMTVGLPGLYSVTVTNSLGCEVSDTIEIIDGIIMDLEIEGDTLVCEGSEMQTLTLTGNFDANATIEWNTGVMGTIAEGADQITVNGGGTYSVTVTNEANCSASTSIDITVRPNPIVDTNPIPPNCGEADGSIELTVTGTGPYMFDWAHLPGMDNVMNPTALAGGTYSVTVTDEEGCSTTANIELTEQAPSKCLPATFQVVPKTSNASGGNRQERR